MAVAVAMAVVEGDSAAGGTVRNSASESQTMQPPPLPRNPRSSAPVVALLVGVLFLCGCSVTYTLNLSAAEIEHSIARSLPVSKSKLLVTLTVRSVSVQFMAGEDRILLRPQVELGIAGQTALVGRALVEGQIRYSAPTGEFFFDHPRVVDLSIQGLPASVRSAAEDLVAIVGETYLATTPVYRLDQKDFKQSLAKLVLKSVQVREGQLEIVLGT